MTGNASNSIESSCMHRSLRSLALPVSSCRRYYPCLCFQCGVAWSRHRNRTGTEQAAHEQPGTTLQWTHNLIRRRSNRSDIWTVVAYYFVPHSNGCWLLSSSPVGVQETCISFPSTAGSDNLTRWTVYSQLSPSSSSIYLHQRMNWKVSLLDRVTLAKLFFFRNQESIHLQRESQKKLYFLFRSPHHPRIAEKRFISIYDRPTSSSRQTQNRETALQTNPSAKL